MTNINFNITHFDTIKNFFENNLLHMKNLCLKVFGAITEDDFMYLTSRNEASDRLWYMLVDKFDEVHAKNWVHRVLELNNRMFNKNYIINDKVLHMRDGGLFSIFTNLPTPDSIANKMVCMTYYVEMFKIMDDYKETMEKEYKINTELVQSNVLINKIKNL